MISDQVELLTHGGVQSNYKQLTKKNKGLCNNCWRTIEPVYNKITLSYLGLGGGGVGPHPLTCLYSDHRVVYLICM